MGALRTHPTATRRLAAGAIVFACASCALLDKIDRDFHTGLTVVPHALSGSWPNLSVVLGGSLLLFATKSQMPFADYAKFALGSAAGMTAYEFAQVWIPIRTFDVWDILASFVGAVISILIARIMFYRFAPESAVNRSNKQ